jgi:hypothetical protein
MLFPASRRVRNAWHEDFCRPNIPEPANDVPETWRENTLGFPISAMPHGKGFSMLPFTLTGYVPAFICVARVNAGRPS